MDKTKLTPLLRQYLDIKEQFKDCLIFFRLGDFYELFFEDAEVAARELNITLTRRGKIECNDIPMCGVPFFQGELYLSRLLKKGFKVAICEQIEKAEESKKRGYKEIIKRKVVRVATPGTLTEEKELDSSDNNFLASLICKEDTYCISWIDISTGETSFKTCDDKEHLFSTLQEVMPSEIIYSKEYLDHNFLDTLKKNSITTITKVDRKYFDYKKNHELLIDAYQNNKEFIISNYSNIQKKVLGSLVAYISFTQNGNIPPISKPNLEKDKKLLQIDASSRKNLEITKTLSGEKKGSLLYAVDYTNTSSGSRKLINDLIYPLANIKTIKFRQELVEFFSDNYSFFNEGLCKLFKSIPDFSRSVIRLSLNRGGPRDLLSILKGLDKTLDLLTLIGSEKFSDIKATTVFKFINPIKKNNKIREIVRVLSLALEERLPLNVKDGGVIKDGFDIQLDQIRKYKHNSKEVILRIESKEKKLSQIRNLRVKFNNFLGFFIEVNPVNDKYFKGNPEKYIHRQTLKNCIRYTSKELVETSQKIINANAEQIEKETEIYKSLVEIVLKDSFAILNISDIVARLDVANSWAIYAKNSNCVKPCISESNKYFIDQGRHPSVEKTHTEKFISNSCNLNKNNKNIFKLITGPNMSGKSTYLRQNAIILIMAQAGGVCPAEKVEIGICDKLFCRVGSGDELAKGNSTFMVEMLETARILNNASSRSLVILDEIGRGTSTFDGMSIAWATTEYLIEEIKCKTLFATHYNELSVLKDKFTEIDLNTFRVKEWNSDLVFLYEIIEGIAESSYGIQVAKMAGVPSQLTKRAIDILEKLETENQKKRISSDQLNIEYTKEKELSVLEKIQEEIKLLKINEISPIQALNILDKYRKKLLNKNNSYNDNE